MTTYTVVHETRDEAGKILYEQLHTGVKVAYFRRRPGQSRHPITLAELQAAMTPAVVVPDHSKPEPASVHAQPAFGPRRL